MALLLSSTDLAIAIAAKRGTLRLVTRASRLGGEYVAIEDDHGLIEVHNSADEAQDRVASIQKRAA